MAAVISTGSATDVIDLIQKLVAWLVTRGYTNNMSAAIPSGGWRAHLNKGSTYVNLGTAWTASVYLWQSQFSASTQIGLNMYLGTGFNGANDFKNQPGGPVQNGTAYSVGVAAVTGTGAITSYQFIDDGNGNILVIIERSPGIFRYVCWGEVTKYGTWTGGAYFGGSSACYYGSTANDTGLVQNRCPFSCGDITTRAHAAFVRADVDTFTGKWLCGGVDTENQGILGWTGKSLQSGIDGSNASSTDVPVINNYMQGFLHSTLSARIITVPIIVYAKRDAGGYSALGELPTLRLCQAVTKGTSVGTDVPLGPDTWRIFNGFAQKVG